MSISRILGLVTTTMFSIPTVVIEFAAMEIRPVFPFKTAMVVLVIDLVTIMTMPPGIRVIRVAGISRAKINVYMNLRRSGASCNKAPGDDHD